MPITDYNIAIVGCGGIAGQHAASYRHRGLNIIAAQDVEAERARRFTEQFGIPYCYNDADEMIRREDVHIVDIATPHDVRLEIVEICARHRKHIFIQKPFAKTMAEARQMIHLAGEAGIRLMVNQNSVFVPAFRALEPHLKDRELFGDIYYAQIENRGWLNINPDHWYVHEKRWIIFAMAVHHFALLRHWFGNVQWVFARKCFDPTQNVIGENLGIVCLHFESGLEALVINNWAFRGDQSLLTPKEDVRIQGTRASAWGTAEGLTIYTEHPHPRKIVPGFEGVWFPDAFGCAMIHLMDCLDSGAEPLCNGRDNLKTLAIGEAAYRSIEETRPVKISEVL